MLAPLHQSAAQQEALDRVTGWTRARFGLAPGDAVFVAEIACAAPGCPPRETVIAFWTGGAVRHHIKIFKPVAAVVEGDLPPPWMKDALIAPEMLGCECCG
jgi:hypothetical protein